MSEWWTYTLSDFLLFSARTYHRLFEIYNAAIWPAQLVTMALGLAVLALVTRGRGPAARGRVIAAILAACWLWVAIAFHARRYSTINWAAIYFAWAFGVQAALLLWAGVFREVLSPARPVDSASRVGLAIFVFALLIEPFSAPLLGRGWRQVEIFGVAPDPTAIGTLGILLLAPFRRRWLLMILPALWCAISGLTLLAMKSLDAWIPPLAAAIAVSLATIQARGRQRTNATWARA